MTVAGRKRVKGVVYFVGFNGQGGTFVKVGWTSGTPRKRIAQMQCGCPFPIDILATVDGTMGDEERFHRLLSEYAEIGEWFFFEDLSDLWSALDRWEADRGQW